LNFFGTGAIAASSSDSLAERLIFKREDLIFQAALLRQKSIFKLSIDSVHIRPDI
jgi:hypothetical protein